MKDKMRVIAEELWSLLDDIDTASDIFKPDDEKSYEAFYRYAMKKSTDRFKHLESDGYKIFTHEEMKQVNLNNKLKKCKSCELITPNTDKKNGG